MLLIKIQTRVHYNFITSIAFTSFLCLKPEFLTANTISVLNFGTLVNFVTD